MLCTHCGTEIADKALICYKCGNATVTPRVAAPTRRRTRWLAPFILLLIVGAIAWLYRYCA